MIRRAKELLATAWHWIPLTAWGAGLIPTIGLVLHAWALREHDRLLLAACVGGLVLLAALALAVVGVAVWLRRVNPQVSDRIEAMESLQRDTGFVIPWLPSIPCIQMEIRWLNCPGVEVSLLRGHGGFHERILPRERMQRERVVRQFEVSDLFGLCRVRFSRVFSQPLRIEPQPAPDCCVTRIHRDQQGDDWMHPSGKPHGDLIEMRHYRPGDPLKLVLWKQYARTGQLLVRQPENSIASLSQTIACFVAGPGDQASAGIARTLVTHWAQAGEELLFQADGAATATDNVYEAIDQLIRSADERDLGGTSVANIGTLVQGNVCKHCIVFLPSQPGPWIDLVLAGQAMFQLQIDAIIGVDEPPARRRKRFLPGWALRRPADGAVQPEQLLAVVQRLSEAGVATQVIHRRSGQALSIASWQRERA